MISIKFTLILIVLSFELVLSKKYKDCDFAEELFIKHDVPLDEVYMHLCIGQSLHTAHQNHGSAFLGIYAIGTQWWCGQDTQGGNCNIKCSDLLDDDIADDVACANKILASHGLQGWQKTEADCRKKYERVAEDCLADINIKTDLLLLGESTIAPPTTTEQSTTRKQSIETVSETQSKGKDFEDDRGISFIVITAITAFALISLVAVIVVKREQIKRYLNRQRDHEFENSLIF